MTKISLRVYNREIEAMIESSQVEEALAHCQHILKTFPMHLETYRLLGKAFLETRSYSDAADIFQRVLMSVPEDFVSHVGMSIIRDDENKLDAAIWHMERAFEIQPSNPAIQDELRKLYGRRDGVQPPKVRLTRDALANMYAQGALYSQAIAEIRAVLADDPNRPDLQVMLARAYSKDGRKNQAIEICTELLKKYPYCFDALRILIDFMPPSDQHEFTQTYRLRARALDPYVGFVTGSIFNSDFVPDGAVNIELLNYDPNRVESGSQPAWASSLGIKLETEKSQQDVPEWLSEKPSEIQPNSEAEILPPALDTEKEERSENEDVPEWMRSSGWEKNMDPTVEISDFDDLELENDEPIEKAEIPEWLKEMAPDEELLDPDKLPDGFVSMLDGNLINSHSEDNLVGKEQERGILEDVTDNVFLEEEIPVWMKDDENNEPIQKESESTEIPQKMEPDQDVFNTLSSEKLHEVNEEASRQPADDISSWLGDSQKDAMASGNELFEMRDDEEDLPDWLKEIGSEKPTSDLEKTNEPIAEINNQSEEHPISGDQIDPKLESMSEEDLPAWLKDDGMEEPVGDLDLTDEPTTEFPIQSEEFPSAMNQIDPKLDSTSEDDLPVWLRDVGVEEPVGDLDLPNEPTTEYQIQSEEFSSEMNQIDPKLEATAEEDLPEWLKDIGSHKPASELDKTNEPFAEIQNHPEVFSIAGDQIDLDINASADDELPNWLNEIDTTQEKVSLNDEILSTLASEVEFSSLVDSGKDTPELLEPLPDSVGLGVEEETQVPTSEDATLIIEPVDDGLHLLNDQDAAMAWLENLAAKQGAKAEELLTKPEDRLEEPPEWVKNSIEDALKSFDDEKMISKPSEPELIGIGKTEENETIIEEETYVTNSTSMDEHPQGDDATEKEELVEETNNPSNDLDDSSQYETEYPLEGVKSIPDVQLSSLVEELSPEGEGQQAGFILNQEQVDNPEPEIVSSQDADVSTWLDELDSNDAVNLQDPSPSKVSEFYGNEISDPLPDWLKEIEKDGSSSEWISEAEKIPEQFMEGNESGLIPDEKDIDDIGEIFPTDASNWNFEVSETEPVLEPLSEKVKPFSSGEWQPIQPEQKLSAEESTEISITGSAHHTNESPLGSKQPDTEILSKIPAKDIEQEAGTLELAQSFIESGEIKKAIEVYTGLVKKGQLLEEVIHDLREATYRYPVEIGIWQLLGDAYMRADRLQDALDSYTKAEELLR